jgi:hypothetical protein
MYLAWAKSQCISRVSVEGTGQARVKGSGYQWALSAPANKDSVLTMADLVEQAKKKAAYAAVDEYVRDNMV